MLLLEPSHLNHLQGGELESTEPSYIQESLICDER